MQHECGSSSCTGAALSVLTNRALFTVIVDCMSGVPGLVVAFVKRVAPQYTPKYARWHRAWHGVLPFMAVKENDLRALIALCKLQRTPQHSANAKLQLHDAELAFAAARYGHVEILQWLYARHQQQQQLIPAQSDHDNSNGNSEQLTTWSAGLLREAIAHGHVAVLQWLWTTRLHERTIAGTSGTNSSESESGDDDNSGVEAIDWRARTHARTFAVVQWLHARGFAFSPLAMDAAAAFGHNDTVRFLHTQRQSQSCTTRAMDAAAEHGHLAIVQFLHTNRFEGCTTHAMDAAAARGHLDVVQFLHTYRQEGCTVAAMDAAALHHHADVVAFLGQHRLEGCSSTALLKAAASGDVPVVQALCAYSAQGCLYDARRIALSWRHNDVLAVLDACIDTRVTSCSMAQHAPNDMRRRCQKLPSNTASRNENERNGSCWQRREYARSCRRSSYSWRWDASAGAAWRPLLLRWVPRMYRALALQPM